MTQYIDKDALVAEIERIKEDALQKKGQCKRRGLERIMHQIGAYNKILSFLDTLEVKEIGVDVGSPEGDIGVKTIWDGDKIVSNKAQKREEI